MNLIEGEEVLVWRTTEECFLSEIVFVGDSPYVSDIERSPVSHYLMVIPLRYARLVGEMVEMLKLVSSRPSGARDLDAYAEVSWATLDKIDTLLSKTKGPQ